MSNMDSINKLHLDSINHISEMDTSINYTKIDMSKIVEVSGTNNLALYLSIFAILLCLGLIIVIILQRRNYRDKIIEIVLNSSRVKQLTSQITQNGNNQSAKNYNRQMSDLDIKQIINKSIDDKREKDINAIVDRVLECIQLDKEKGSKLGVINNNSEPITAASHTKPNLLYATPADNGVFEKTTSEVTDDSFYILRIDSNKKNADFELLNTEKVTTKVIKVHDFLNSSCEKSGSGTTRIITTDKGRAELQPNGKWKVITKAKVKFE